MDGVPRNWIEWAIGEPPALRKWESRRSFRTIMERIQHFSAQVAVQGGFCPGGGLPSERSRVS
jgi:hypothetical protein